MPIGDEFRKKADEQRSAATVLLEADDLRDNVKKQVIASAGLTTANVLDSLASLADFIEGSGHTDRLLATREKIARQNAALRDAAAKGDWDEFNRVAAGVGTGQSPGNSTGGNGTSGGGA